MGEMEDTSEFRSQHPLLVQFSEQGNLLLPKHAIGDPDRLEQVSINII